MKKSDFFYDLPQELIAQRPIEPRDHSKLLVFDKKTEDISHKHFYDILHFLQEGDCLVLNDTKVLPARLYGEKVGTGARVEFLLLHSKGDDVWECIVGPGKKARPQSTFSFGQNLMTAEVLEVLENGNRKVHFKYEGNFYEILDKVGQMPLPHYITERLEEKDRYQTIYAKEEGSAAAPTAGLHFTKELIEKIKQKGVDIAYITLHVGLGTFRPVKAENIEDHKMHAEYYTISQKAADQINKAKSKGGRIIAVGTTSCRTLESAADENGLVKASNGWTSIFIYPGYKFSCVDALISNFHLPESTLIMLVSAFCGSRQTKTIYKEAVDLKYRFYSFGDAMFIK